LYGIYQPRVPNDVGLFRIWEDALVKRGVVIMKNATIEKFVVDADSSKIAGIGLRDSREIAKNKPVMCTCKKIILACPPQQVQHILNQHEELGAAFGPDFERFQEETQYLPYISVIFHWSSEIKVPKIWGYPRTSWGVGNIVLSDYMDFNDPRSKTVISTVITMPDAPSDALKVSANEIGDKRGVMKEVFRQLQQIYPDLPEPDYQFLTQSAYDAERRQWMPFNHAFMTTTHGYMPNQSALFDNLYNCGVQNGNSSYSFTSMESSVANAVHLATELQPEVKDLKVAKVREATTVRESIGIIAAVTVVSLIALNQFRKSKPKSK
jgi:hypothetical protein